MLQEKLEQESRAARHRRIQLALGLVASVAVIGLAYGGIVLLRSTGVTPDVTSVSRAADKVPETPARTPAPAIGSSSSDAAPDAAATEAANAAAREAFKRALAAFQAEIEPAIAHDDFARWDPLSQRRILDGKETAISLFSQASYAAAVDKLASSRAAAETALAARDDAFTRALAAAGAAHGADDYDAASLAIDRALTIRPGSADAAALKQRIDALPALLERIEAAAVARVENNPEAERGHLEAALAIDPARGALEPRLAEVRRLLREARFTRHIADGLKDVTARRLAAAQRNLDAARAIHGGRAEVDVLDEKVAALQITLMIERLTEAARAAARADDWAAAERAYVEVRRLAPADRDITEGLALAQRINGLQARAARHLAVPERLASEAVAAEAGTVVAAAATLRDDSPRLAAQADALAETIAAYARKVPVRIVSDGETNITVRGVGIVGKVTDRTIELRPGRYTFEGVREGFQAVLMQVNIGPGQTDLVLEIVPDERI